jgi:glycosyltransferase involved in cell wall biosynthesis
MNLQIAIPALNEEGSIQQIIERSLAAVRHIVSKSPVTHVAITVVSDGSTDRTVAYASQYIDRIKLIVFEQNRGYGAAIQRAWDESEADLLGFLDADGTCDPKFFADLARALVEQRADIALGCRLNPNSRMPLLRQAGNVFFAGLLTVLSGKRVRDSASGMRIVTRAAYERMRPLPNGLHFTPAMSARALLDTEAGLKIVELDMPYNERVGRSKLNAVKDGMRFLNVIGKTAVVYRPGRVLGLVVGAGVALGTIAYLANRRASEKLRCDGGC